jgi:formate dehydrogenase
LELLKKEIQKLIENKIVEKNHIIIRRGAGAYICGEESAMIESIEGKRGLPRHRPPFVASVGLFGKPTLVNNVETVYWLRDIIEKGPSWYANQGKNGRKGFHSFSVSGRVKIPGVKVAPAGITVQELIEDYSGGMLDGHKFKAYLPGGASGGILPASLNNIPLDYGVKELDDEGCFLGSAAIVILSDQDKMKDVGLSLLRFFEEESCGQCTPCRVGTFKKRNSKID